MTRMRIAAVVAALVAVVPQPQATAAPPAPGHSEPITDHFFGTGAIPRDHSAQTIVSRHVTTSSRIFVGVDTTSLASFPATAMPGVRVSLLRDGWFKVRAIDSRPATGNGIPFTYVVVNATTSLGSVATGSITLNQGAPSVGVFNSAITPTSRILLSVESTNPTKMVRVLGKFSGKFDLQTVDRQPVPTTTKVHYLIANDSTCVLACGDAIPGGKNSDVALNAGIVTAGAVLVTPTLSDTTVHPHGLRVYRKSAGQAVVTTPDFSFTQTAIPFDFFVFRPPPRWEELGPTGVAGVGWSMLIHPTNRNLQWVATTSGVWKTVNGGDTWYRSWRNLPITPIYRLAMAPDNPSLLYALGHDASIYVSGDGGSGWTRLTPPAGTPMIRRVFLRSGFLAGPRGVLYVCGTGNQIAGRFHGLVRVDLQAGTFSPEFVGTAERSDAAGAECDDVTASPDGRVYAAFRRSVGADGTVYGGVYTKAADTGAAWHKIKEPLPDMDTVGCSSIDPCGPRPLRIAATNDRLLLNYDCLVFVNTPAAIRVPKADLDKTWQQSLRRAGRGFSPGLQERGFVDPRRVARVCGGSTFASQGGYNLTAAISPTNPNHFIVFGNLGYVTFDGGQTWFPDATKDNDYQCGKPLANCPHINLGQDHHETHFWSDDVVYDVNDGSGPSVSTNGGKDWFQTSSPTSELAVFSGGPPISEFYNLTAAQPDPFGRVFVAANAQDHGGVAMLGRTTGLGCCGGEGGMTVAGHRVEPSAENSVVSTFTTYEKGQQVHLCRFTVPGPDYRVPDDFRATSGKHLEAGYPPLEPCVPSNDMGSPVTALGMSRGSTTGVLAGLQNGTLWRVQSTSPSSVAMELLPGQGSPNMAVSSIYFAGDNDAYVGYNDGRITRIAGVFSAAPAYKPIFTFATSPGQPVQPPIIGFAGPYGNAKEVYVARPADVWFTRDADANIPPFDNVSGGSTTALSDNLGKVPPGFPPGTPAAQVVGIVKDDATQFVYVATGVISGFTLGRSYRYTTGADAAVFRGVHPRPDAFPPNLAWTRLTEGMPQGLPITGITMSPNRALFVSTFGHGIWWRRDVGEAANAGVNDPMSVEADDGELVTITTTCSDPKGWRHVRSLEFKLADGAGAEDGRPYAFWGRFDQDRGLIQVYDGGRWIEGKPGEARVLRAGDAELDLARTSARGFGPTDPKFEIRWALRVRDRKGRSMQQWLRVTDDDGTATAWAPVGDWTVPMPFPVAGAAVLGGMVLLVAAGMVSARRRRSE